LVIKVQVADLVTGDRIQTLPTSNVRWEKRVTRPESVSVSMTLLPRAHQRLEMRNSTVEAKTALIVADDDVVLGAGPIWERTFDDADGRLSIDAEGVWSLLDRRNILPDTVSTLPLLIEAGDDAGEPNPAVRTAFVAKTWPQIVRGLIEQSETRPGGGLPFVFGPTGAGSHDKTYEASAFKTVGEALTDLTKLMGGPEIAFVPRIVDNKLQWLVRVGDDDQLKIQSPTVHLFDFTPAKKSVRGLRVKSSGAEMASEVWGTGGRQAALALFSRAYSSRLIDAGFPRMEIVSSAHSTVVEKPTLDKYTEADLAAASAPLEWWSWEFHADRMPRLADVNVGDICTVRLRGNRYLPDGDHQRRIVALSGDSSSRWVRVTTDEVTTW
jgi:hypothetical protein